MENLNGHINFSHDTGGNVSNSTEGEMVPSDDSGSNNKPIANEGVKNENSITSAKILKELKELNEQIDELKRMLASERLDGKGHKKRKWSGQERRHGFMSHRGIYRGNADAGAPSGVNYDEDLDGLNDNPETDIITASDPVEAEKYNDDSNPTTNTESIGGDSESSDFIDSFINIVGKEESDSEEDEQTEPVEDNNDTEWSGGNSDNSSNGSGEGSDSTETPARTTHEESGQVAKSRAEEACAAVGQYFGPEASANVAAEFRRIDNINANTVGMLKRKKELQPEVAKKAEVITYETNKSLDRLTPEEVEKIYSRLHEKNKENEKDAAAFVFGRLQPCIKNAERKYENYPNPNNLKYLNKLQRIRNKYFEYEDDKYDEYFRRGFDVQEEFELQGGDNPYTYEYLQGFKNLKPEAIERLLKNGIIHEDSLYAEGFGPFTYGDLSMLAINPEERWRSNANSYNAIMNETMIGDKYLNDLELVDNLIKEFSESRHLEVKTLLQGVVSIVLKYYSSGKNPEDNKEIIGLMGHYVSAIIKNDNTRPSSPAFFEDAIEKINKIDEKQAESLNKSFNAQLIKLNGYYDKFLDIVFAEENNNDDNDSDGIFSEKND